MYFQMIRVISSPSSSTTGLVTLIFAMIGRAFWEQCAFEERRGLGCGGHSTPGGPAEAEPLCTFSPSFARQPDFAAPEPAALESGLRSRACHDVPGDDDPADQRPRQARS